MSQFNLVLIEPGQTASVVIFFDSAHLIAAFDRSPRAARPPFASCCERCVKPQPSPHFERGEESRRISAGNLLFSHREARDSAPLLSERGRVQACVPRPSEIQTQPL